MIIHITPADDIQSAIDTIHDSGEGGIVYLSSGTFSSDIGIVLKSNITLIGEGFSKTIIKRIYTDIVCAEFITMQDVTSIRHLKIDANQDDSNTIPGVGIMIQQNCGFQYIENISISGFREACIEFPPNSGSGFIAIASTFYTTGTPGIHAAVKVNGIDSAAVPRMFYMCQGGGSTLFDFGGAKDFFVSGGYTNGLIFGPESGMVLCTNLRIGATSIGLVKIKGGEHSFSSCVFANPVELTSEAINCSLSFCSVSKIIDEGLGSRFIAYEGFDNIEWFVDNIKQSNIKINIIAESSDIAQIIATKQRLANKSMITMKLTFMGPQSQIDLYLKNGDWSFSLPYKDSQFHKSTGTALITDASTGIRYTGVAVTRPGEQRLEVFFNGSSSPLSSNNSTSSGYPIAKWEPGDEVQIQLMYD